MGGAVRTRAPAGALIAVLTSCSVGPNFERPKPPAGPVLPAGPQETAAAEGIGGNSQRFVTDMDIPGRWWSLFHSEKLDHLIDQALRANPNVVGAQAALKQARENLYAQQAQFFPTVTGNFSASRNKTANEVAPFLANNALLYNLYTPQLSVTYVIDIWGANRREVESLQAQADYQRFQLEATYLTLAANVAVEAVQEASLRGQIVATERLVALQHELTVLVEKQRAATLGTASELDLLAQQAAEAQTAAALPPLQKQLKQTRDALTALLGRMPVEEPDETFLLTELTLPHDLPISLPSKLVEQRPDIRSAEELMHAATAQVGVAIAAMLPNISLTANVGTTATQASQLFQPGNGFWSVAGSLDQTIFDAGANLHKRRAADAAMDQAAAQYKETVITAFQNVADGLHALRSDADALKASANADGAAKKAFDLASHQYKLGTISYVALLNAEQSYQQAELGLVQAQANRYADTVGLFQALGGGWWNDSEALNEQPGPAGR
jgi:NodT family efflux transporter outer membrane factor (OMF) lipoprotein